MNDVLKFVWNVLNSPAGITAVAGLLLYGLNWLYSRKPLWQQYEGTIISAIRTAEKLVPDDTQNASLAKFDAALQFVLKVFEERNNRQATIAEKAALQEGINILHNKLDGAGALNVPSGAATPAEVRS